MAQPKRINARNLVTVLSIMVLVGTEVAGVAIAGGWALAGLFELGDMVGYALMVVFGLMALYILTILWRRCTAVEPISEAA